MDLNKDRSLFKDVDDLFKTINKFSYSQQTIEYFVQWMVDYFQLYGSAFVEIKSGKGLGAEWKSYYPKNLFSARLFEVDFNEQALFFQRSPTPFTMSRSALLENGDAIRDWVKRHDIETSFVIPIQYDIDVEALCILYRTKEQAEFTDQMMEVASIITRLVANILKWQIQVERVDLSIKELDQMLRASLSMTESLKLNEVLHAILDNALQLLPDANDAHIFLYENDILKFGAAMFQNGIKGKVWAEPREDGLTYRVARSGKMIIINNMQKDPLYMDIPDWKGAIIGIPLLVGNDVMGVMTLAKLTTVGFSAHEIEILDRLSTQASNVIQNVRTHDLISTHAFTDSLTALPNRRSFDWESQKILDQAQRYNRTFTIAMLDLDEFKRINDTYGHAIGDDSLRIVAHCMKSAIRKSDFLARFGWDEFVILFPETTKEMAHTVLENLLDRVDKCRIPIEKERFESLTVSYGIASFPVDAGDLKTLINLADQQLYLQKQGFKHP
ncbi:MAG: sensor domain-containing diguanylate cyclase [Anaerolineaceae bacterium]